MNVNIILLSIIIALALFAVALWFSRTALLHVAAFLAARADMLPFLDKQRRERRDERGITWRARCREFGLVDATDESVAMQ